ncbi:hypothetical protein [Arthrobacter caoxuetaonis]|uniref:Uncharacterized protein n=1 Tax=Arthrobacter caoxuetaonis TaxID=2886935 RepID=A0A9X1SE06_9MICC|nr:hypothetical protein [Arthrobacter caoxuetaonis]MCC3299352.1 hypothetical protein [Arthrobacter caoxuetaonis]USQ59155.1 hypothetical protein NF551_18790 [Arthrobacter caoxuetaonis]
MTTVTRENVRLQLQDVYTNNPEPVFCTYSGTLVWDTAARTLDLVDPGTGELIIRLSKEPGDVGGSGILLKDVPYPTRMRGVIPEAAGALNSLMAIGAVERHPRIVFNGRHSVVEPAADLGAAAQEAQTRTATVTLFKDSGKYSVQEAWRLPVRAVTAADMIFSPDFRRIGNGGVLVDANAAPECPEAENWGVPQLLTSIEGARA